MTVSLAEKGAELARGKTKTIYAYIPDGRLVFIESRDDITAGDGAKHDTIPMKGVWANTTTCNVFEFLKRNGIPTHFRFKVDERHFLAWALDMIPLELVARRLTWGSYLQRHPEVPRQQRFNLLCVEVFLKDDSRHDPKVTWDGQAWDLWDAHRPATLVGELPFITSREGRVVTYEQVKLGLLYLQWTFETLERALFAQSIILVDLKIEVGLAYDGKLVVGDVVDNDSWRIWPGGDPKAQLDKQVYREGADSLDAIATRYKLVAEITSRFIQ